MTRGARVHFTGAQLDLVCPDLVCPDLACWGRDRAAAQLPGLGAVRAARPALRSPVREFDEQALLRAIEPAGAGDTLPPRDRPMQVALPGSPEQAEALQAHAVTRQAARATLVETAAVLAAGRRTALLAALASDDPAEVETVNDLAQAYFTDRVAANLSEDDLPLMIQLYATPGAIAGSRADRALRMSPEPVQLAVVDAVLDLVADPGRPKSSERETTQRREVLKLLRGYTAAELASRLDRFDAVAATEYGRHLAPQFIAARGVFGPDQLPALFAYRDARIADGKPVEGYRVAYDGVCAMGEAGRAHVKSVLPPGQTHKPFLPKSAVRAFVGLGFTDDEIRAHFDFDGQDEANRKWAEERLGSVRRKYQPIFARWAARNEPLEARPLGSHPCF